jgi:hypothetical protein
VSVVRVVVALSAVALTVVWAVAAAHGFRGDLCFASNCRPGDLWFPGRTVAWFAPALVAVLTLGLLALRSAERRAPHD